MTTKPETISIEKAISRIESAKEVLITTHARADGDALGSALGLARMIRQTSRRARVMLHEPVSPRYSFLPDVDTAETWPTDAGKIACAVERVDLLVIVDTCARAQLDAAAAAIEQAKIPRLAIDHHVTRDPIVDEIVLDTSAGACAQLIVQLAEAAGWDMDASAAVLLFTGLATDTGWFRFSNADAAAFATAARLLARGVRPNELYERVYLSEPESRVRLMGAVMSSFELRADGRLAIIRVTRDMLRRCGANEKMTEEVINETHRVGSVIASAILIEPASEDEPVRVSLRSKHSVNVAQVAAKFGGGGHERAAGVRMEGPFEAAVQTITQELERVLP